MSRASERRFALNEGLRLLRIIDERRKRVLNIFGRFQHGQTVGGERLGIAAIRCGNLGAHPAAIK
jgi:hypothetical protein